VKSKKIGVVDSGVSNISSVVFCLKRLNYLTKIAQKPESLDDSDVILLPGVGSFPSAMANLKKNNFDLYLKNAALNQRKIIGICLGMQLLTSSSTEGGNHEI
jgi:glutamine amidotransferase